MKKKMVWTVELPGKATDTGTLFSVIKVLGGKVVDIEEKNCDFTDEECLFWRRRWDKLPLANYYFYRGSTMYAIGNCAGDKIRIGVAKCRDDDTFNYLFGRALADARLYGDRKLERALLHFTPKQIEEFF